MRKILMTIVVALFVAPSLFAVPRLQLYIDGATYDDVTETWVTSANSFDLYVIGNGIYDEVFVSMALEGLGETGDPSGSGVTVDGSPYPTGSWTWGYAPLSNVPGDWDGGNDDLAKHGIYPAWYSEFSAGSFGEVGGVGDVNYDSAMASGDPFWLPTEGYIPGGNHLGEYKKFTINITGAFGVHFDAYTLNNDGTIEYFAPFSHDAYGGKVPEPATMLLFGIGLAGAGIVRRFRKKS